MSDPVIEWDLSHVLPATSGPAFEDVLRRLEADSRAIEAARPDLEKLEDPAQLLSLFERYTSVKEVAHRLGSYGSLRFAVDTSDEAAKSFMSRMDDLTTDVDNRIRFLELWWKSLPDDRAARLAPADPDLAYFARRLRSFREHTLTEPEERVVAVKDVTGSTALDRLREILTTAFRYKDPKSGELVTQPVLVRRVYEPDPAVREGAYRELWRVHGEHESPLTFLYQTVVTDWSNEQLKLRGHRSPISVRNKANDVPDEVVETMLRVCRDNRELFQRYFLWKGKRLGLRPMSRFHLYAPLRDEKVEIPYEDARDKVLGVFERFSPRIGREARKVFDERHVHVYPAPNKRGGAFCATVNARLTPYVFLNYTADHASLKTLAHEMGHAVHSLLARDRHPLVAHSALPLAETASVFAEMLLHRELLAECDERTRAALISEKLGEMYATVMRQAYFVLFEIEAHDAIRAGATPGELHAIYLRQLREQFGPVEVPEEFRLEWTYVPHIYASPFYCYAYSFGMLLSLALYGMYAEEGPGFVPKYEALLAAGGSESPERIVARIGADIRDRAFWQKGFDVIAEMVRDLEKTSPTA